MTTHIRAYYKRYRNWPTVEARLVVPHEPQDSITLIEELACRYLGIRVTHLTRPLTRRCADAGCKHFLDLATPYCPTHAPQPLRIHTVTSTTMTVPGAPMSARGLNRNLAYITYARVHGMTVAQRWDADNNHTGPFDTWVVLAKQRFHEDHPEASTKTDDGTITITDLASWFLWLNGLRRDYILRRDL